MDAFGAVAEPLRRRILDQLLQGERPVGALVEALDVSQPMVSRHLRILRDAGLVSVDARAQQRWYRLETDAFRDVDAWLTPYREFWARRLDSLESYLNGSRSES